MAISRMAATSERSSLAAADRLVLREYQRCCSASCSGGRSSIGRSRRLAELPMLAPMVQRPQSFRGFALDGRWGSRQRSSIRGAASGLPSSPSASRSRGVRIRVATVNRRARSPKAAIATVGTCSRKRHGAITIEQQSAHISSDSRQANHRAVIAHARKSAASVASAIPASCLS